MKVLPTNLPPDLRASFAALSAELADVPKSTAESDGLLQQAALVGHFDLNWLGKRAGSPEHRSAVLDASEPLESSLNLWRLRAPQRQMGLEAAAMDAELLAKRLRQATPLPEDRVGSVLQRLVQQHRVDPASEDEATLEAMLEASTWLRTVDAIPSPDPRAIRRELSRQRRARRLTDLADRFLGREDELARLRAFAADPSRGDGRIPVLPVTGIGGIGKSALLAQLLKDWVHVTPPDAAAPLAFHLDFDRFGLAGAQVSEWWFELSRQLALLVPTIATSLDERRREAEAAMERRYGASAPSSPSDMVRTEALESFGYAEDAIAFGLLDNVPQASKLQRRTLLMLFDTVEVLQVRSIERLDDLARWLRDVHHTFADVRVVLCGRVAATLPGWDFANQTPPIELDELAPHQAVGLLGRLNVAPEVAAELVAEFGGNPLVLRLLAQLSRRPGFDLTRVVVGREERTAADKELIQGVLYRRILAHVGDDTVRRLAHPGLAVRRVTLDVLRRVIAPVCLDKTIEVDEAAKLYQALASEVWLVEPSPDGKGIVHRSDLRKLIMKLVARDDEELAKAQRIHWAAIAYYESEEGRRSPGAADEALYHRFMIRGGEMLPPLDEKTAARARAAIGSGLDELPRDAAVALRVALGQAVKLEDARVLPDALWLRFVGRRGAELVERDAFAEAVELIGIRPVPLDDPLVHTWLLPALDALARWRDLLDVLDRLGEPKSQETDILLLTHRLAAASKLGLPADAFRAGGQILQRLERLNRLPPNAELLRLWQATARASLDWSWQIKLIKLTTTDLLRDPELALEWVRLLQAADLIKPFRPVRAQFVPWQPWLEHLRARAGSVAESRLSKLIQQFAGEEKGGMAIGRCLGHYAQEFEALWTDPFVQHEIPEAAAAQMLAVREFPEFRRPVRAALLEQFSGEDELRLLVEHFRPLLPIPLSDLVEPGLSRTVSRPREGMTNLVAIADRFQLLHALIDLACETKRSSLRLRLIQDGLRNWLTPDEQLVRDGLRKWHTLEEQLPSDEPAAEPGGMTG
ncbi:hypothetical protein LPLAFNJD_LOCUS2350 [Methylorubrum aminovorans]